MSWKIRAGAVAFVLVGVGWAAQAGAQVTTRGEIRSERREGRVEARTQPGVFDGDREIIDRGPAGGEERRYDADGYGRAYDRRSPDDYPPAYRDDYQSDGQATLGVTLDPDSRHGASIERVMRGSPADRAGLRSGDTILAVNGRRIRSAWDLTNLVDRLSPGEVIDIEFARPQRQSTQARLASGRSSEYAERRPIYDDDFRYDDRRAYSGYRGNVDETTVLRPDPDRDIDEGLLFDRDRDGRRLEGFRPRD